MAIVIQSDFWSFACFFRSRRLYFQILTIFFTRLRANELVCGRIAASVTYSKSTRFEDKKKPNKGDAFFKIRLILKNTQKKKKNQTE